MDIKKAVVPSLMSSTGRITGPRVVTEQAEVMPCLLAILTDACHATPILEYAALSARQHGCKVKIMHFAHWRFTLVLDPNFVALGKEEMARIQASIASAVFVALDNLSILYELETIPAGEEIDLTAFVHEHAVLEVIVPCELKFGAPPIRQRAYSRLSRQIAGLTRCCRVQYLK